MSDVINTSSAVADPWAQFVVDQQAKQSGSNSNPTNNYSEYQGPKWAGITDQYKAFRLLGTPNTGLSKPGPYTVREVNWTRIKDDQGKTMYLTLPAPDSDEAQTHTMWKIINRVLEVSYVKDETGKNHKTFKNESTHPSSFAIVSKGGYKPEDGKNYQYSKGWKGQKVAVVNCIDRSQMDWHRANKKTMLLSKNVSAGQDGTEFADTGVPSFGFLTNLSTVVQSYGNWENYDIGIRKTGIMNNPYSIVNASAYKVARLPELPAQLYEYVADQGPLTDEERSFELYDLTKAVPYTSYTKIKNRLSNAIQLIDAEFGTNYLGEIADKAAKEAAAREADKAANPTPAQAPVAPAPVAPAPVTLNKAPEPVAPAMSFNEMAPVQPTAPVAPAPVTRATAAPVAAGIDTSILKGWSHLTEEQKAQVKSAVRGADGIIKVEYQNVDPDDYPTACETCGTLGLLAHTHCIGCGAEFN